MRKVKSEDQKAADIRLSTMLETVGELSAVIRRAQLLSAKLLADLPRSGSREAVKLRAAVQKLRRRLYDPEMTVADVARALVLADS